MTETITYTPEQQATNRKAWATALRSGEYKQGRKYLHKIVARTHYFCCLGVACDLAIKAGVKMQHDDTGIQVYQHDGIQVYQYNGKSGYLPPPVQLWLGLKTTDGSLKKPVPIRDGYELAGSLVAVNDGSNIPFPEIADIIDSGNLVLVGEE